MDHQFTMQISEQLLYAQLCWHLYKTVQHSYCSTKI